MKGPVTIRYSTIYDLFRSSFRNCVVANGRALNVNGTLIPMAARYMRAELAAPMLWVMVALTAFMLAAMPPPTESMRDAWCLSWFALTSTAFGWLIGLPTICTFKALQIRAGVMRQAAVIISVAIMMIPLSLIITVSSGFWCGTPIGLDEIFASYSRYLLPVALGAISLDHFVSREVETMPEIADWLKGGKGPLLDTEPDEAAADIRRVVNETWDHFSHLASSYRFWVTIGVFLIVFIVLGPLDTYRLLTIPERAGMWTLVFAVIFLIAMPVIIFTRLSMMFRGVPIHIALPVSAVLGEAAAFLPHLFVKSQFVPTDTSVWNAAIVFVSYAPAYIAATFLVWELVSKYRDLSRAYPWTKDWPARSNGNGNGIVPDRAVVAPRPVSAQVPELVSQLPQQKRGALVSIVAEDHYVRCTTDKGTTMLRMPLHEAIDATTPVTGIRIHRSAWIAGQAIRSVRRSGRGIVVELTDGQQFKPSRTGARLLRDAGFRAG